MHERPMAAIGPGFSVTLDRGHGPLLQKLL
ncbi:hypothetical protein SAMN05216562_1556 [Microbulbifer marinus]|uniref:Uncharacterized protein n=1 Tax=Microbulbifer marinus TaxID=658218 RepID=A0A1H3XJY6_9GAMM|nr:hypothetical protein SAMN05216562_1556 [Microbulbifer marinus]